MTDPAVSFVVPAKDEAAYLPTCLESLRDQRTDREYEVLVVDGDSDDATAQIADLGLTETVVLRLDWHRIRADY